MVHRQELFDSLQFNDDAILHNEIESVTAIQTASLVLDRQIDLPLVSNAALTQLMTEALFVR